MCNARVLDKSYISSLSLTSNAKCVYMQPNMNACAHMNLIAWQSSALVSCMCTMQQTTITITITEQHSSSSASLALSL